MSNTFNMSDFKPVDYNIEIVSQDTWSELFELFLDTIPINLTGSTITISVYKGCSTSAALFTATNGSGVTIIGVSNNKISVSKKVTLAKGDYIWDLKVVFPDLTTKTYVWGDFIVYETKNNV